MQIRTRLQPSVRAIVGDVTAKGVKVIDRTDEVIEAVLLPEMARCADGSVDFTSSEVLSRFALSQDATFLNESASPTQATEPILSAKLKKAEAALKLAKLDLDRMEKLAASQSASATDVAHAEARVQEEEANVELAMAQLKAIQKPDPLAKQPNSTLNDPKSVVISVVLTHDGSIRVGGDELSADKLNQEPQLLTALLMALKKKNASDQVVVTAAKVAPQSSVVRVLDAVNAAQAGPVTIQSTPSQ